MPAPIPLAALPLHPTSFPSCCASLSLPLLHTLHALLPPPPALTLSVGSGSGLLESLLLQLSSPPAPNVVGVEISGPSSPLSPQQQHLPPHRRLAVPSSVSLHPEALLASALLLVYPRDPGLVRRYLAFCRGGCLETVVWLGPRQDWAEFFEVVLGEACVDVKCVEMEGGLEPSEVLAVGKVE